MLSWVGAPVTQAQIPALSPFAITGFIDQATLNPPGDVLAGGTITVNGQVVIVPRNLIVLMPANALTWQQVFAQAPAPWGIPGTTTVGGGVAYNTGAVGPTTGLALRDCAIAPTPTGCTAPPLTTYQATISGNRVGNRMIAATIALTPDALGIGQGFINFIDYAVGEMRVGGILNDPNSGIRLRINDPIAPPATTGKFSKGLSPDRRFTIDEENPTIRTVTGFPMCLQRGPTAAGDALCPTGNRPPEAGPITQPNFPQQRLFPLRAAPGSGLLPDPWLMMPFEVGDFVDYAGITVSDTTGTAGPLPANGTAGTYISAYSITANLSAYTQPGTDPAYLAIDVLLVETGPFLNPIPPPGVVSCVVAAGAECGKRSRLEGFTTDLGRIIHLNGVHVDPLLGTTRDSFPWNTTDTGKGGVGFVAVPDTDPLPPVGAQPGRWRFRPSNRTFTPYNTSLTDAEVPATVHASLECPQAPLTPIPGCVDSNIPRTTNPNGLVYGHYSAPIFEFISVENIIGAPPVPINYEDYHLALGDPVERSGFFFLWRGQGPVGTPGGLPAGTGPIVGRLNPFPISLALGPLPVVPPTLTGGPTADVAYFHPPDGTWHIHPAVGVPVTVQWGQSGDVPVAKDYTGDGRSDIAVWRPAEGNWYIINSATGVPAVPTQWGQVNDVPVPADYTGDGKADIAVWRPAEGNWYIINSTTSAVTVTQWGTNGDVPVPGDYDGDGKADIAVWRPADGNWYVRNSATGTVTVTQWGLNGDVPVPADYDGDGKTDIAVWRPADGNWYVINSASGTVTVTPWGANGDIPICGKTPGAGQRAC
jgi:hypothetical protein